MATTNGNRKLLDLKRWEPVSPLQLWGSAQGSVNYLFSMLRHVKQMVFHFGPSRTEDQIYDVREDGWSFTASRTISNNQGSGVAIAGHVWSTGSTVGASFLTATAGTTSTITTNQTLVRDLRGWPIHILSGPNAGVTLTIVSNTIGANSVITVATQASAFSASTTYRLMTPRWYILPSYSTPIFRAYDWATNSYLTLSTTNLPASTSTFATMCATPSWRDSDYNAFATGTATSATATTLVNSAKTWSTNQWTNFQVRIVSGTGAGQIRVISSNTATTLTVPTWTTTPDSTSVYSIEGNDDILYMVVNNSTNLYKYSISTNTWTATSGISNLPNGAGPQFVWASNVSDSAWTNESNIQNGRYIHWFDTGSSGTLRSYDIANGTTSGVTTSFSEYVNSNTVGSFIHNDIIYFFFWASPGYHGRMVAFNLVTKDAYGIGRTPTQAYATVTPSSNAFFVATYKDGATTIDYLYFGGYLYDQFTGNGAAVPMYRMMLI